MEIPIEAIRHLIRLVQGEFPGSYWGDDVRQINAWLKENGVKDEEEHRWR